MKKKLYKILAVTLTMICISLGIIFGVNKDLLLYAEEVQTTLSLYGKRYATPTTIYIGYFDYQSDEAGICASYVVYENGVRHIEDPIYTIRDEESLRLFNTRAKNYVFLIDQDTYYDYEDDALSCNFLIVANSPVTFSAGQVLNGKTISELKTNYSSNIVDLIVPDEFELEDARLEDTVVPEFANYEAVYITNIDHPITVDEIKSKLTAFDNIDGDITHKIYVHEDNYTEATKLVNQSYSVKFRVQDTSLNMTEITIHIKVEDITAPVISGPSEITTYTSSPIQVSDIQDSLSVNDNFDSNENLTLSLYSDKYTTKKSIPGDYEVTFIAKDSSDNKGYKTVVVHVVDDEKPTISGSSSYVKSTTATLPISIIMSNLQAVDKQDGDLSNKITVKTDNYTGHEKEVGNHTIIFYVKDNANNISEDFLVTIQVKDNELPIFYIDNTMINISEYDSMTHQEIVSYLLDSQNITKSVKKTAIIYDDYSKNKSTPGEYQVSVKVTYEDDTTQVLNLSVNVNRGEERDDLNEDGKLDTPSIKLPFFARIGAFFTRLTKNVENFFLNVWIKIRNIFN